MAAASATIYCLRDPSTGQVRYVGKTNDLPGRMRQHRWEGRSSDLQTHKVRWLRNLSGDPIAEILEVVSHSVWAERECFWIKKFRDEGANLTNIADGGQTSPVEGRGHSAESKEKMRASAIASGSKPPSRKGSVTSAETKLKLRDAMLKRGAKSPWLGGWNKGLLMGRPAWNKGRRATPEEIEKNRLGHKGIPWSQARRDAQNARVAKKGSL